MPSRNEIRLGAPLGLRSAWRFPLQSRESRRDLVIGGLWLLVPVIGWLMNMGHRIVVTHKMHKGEAPWPSWGEPSELLRHGLLTFAGMVWFGWPGVGLALAGWYWQSWALGVAGVLLWLAAVAAIPGYMTHYCKELDAREIFHPVRALSRVRQGGLAYWKAWAIVLPTMAASFLGLLAFGVGFVFTSVWFWQVAAFCFASVFTQRFGLGE